MSEMNGRLLEHTRSAAVDGRKVMFGTIATCTGLAVLLPFVFPEIWDLDRGLLLAWYMIIAVVSIAGVTYGVQNIRSGGTFYCRLSKDRLHCHSPVPGCGETFSIAVGEISTIEEVTRHETTSAWYICDHSGNRYNLTTNYGNPAEQFIEHIRTLNPSAEFVKK